MGTLIRESDPPAGFVASPIPQYRLAGTADTYEAVEGQNGASFTIMTDVDGNPITDNNGLLVKSDDIAQETTLSGFRTDFQNEDFASETTLSSIDEKVATQTTLNNLLTAFNNENFSQEDTLTALKNVFDTVGNDDVGLLIESLEGKDFAEQTTLNNLKERFNTDGENEVGKLIETLENKVATQAELEAVKSELETIKANQTNGDQKVQQTGSNDELINTTVTWAENIDADVENEVEITIPENLQKDNMYLVLIHNESTVSALSATLKVKWTDEGANARETEAISFDTVATEAGESELVQGALLADGAKLVLSNDTELGAGEGFSAYVQVREV